MLLDPMMASTAGTQGLPGRAGIIFSGIPSLFELGSRHTLYPGPLFHCPRRTLLFPPEVACHHICRPAILGLLRVIVGIPASSLVHLEQAPQVLEGSPVPPRVSSSWFSSPQAPLLRPGLSSVAHTGVTGKDTFPNKEDTRLGGTGNLVEVGT